MTRDIHPKPHLTFAAHAAAIAPSTRRARVFLIEYHTGACDAVACDPAKHHMVPIGYAVADQRYVSYTAVPFGDASGPATSGHMGLEAAGSYLYGLTRPASPTMQLPENYSLLQARYDISPAILHGEHDEAAAVLTVAESMLEQDGAAEAAVQIRIAAAMFEARAIDSAFFRNGNPDRDQAAAEGCETVARRLELMVALEAE